MHRVMLGKSGISISRLAFGTLTVSPLQKGFSVDKASSLMMAAYTAGINLFDTAQLYQTYQPLRILLKRYPDAIIATKSYAHDRKGAQEAFDEARRELDKDVIDIFMLHEQESQLTLKGHREAFDFYLSMKIKGKIRAVGMSTHCVNAAAYAPRYGGIDVLHPLLNVSGLGICGGTRDEMSGAVNKAHQAGIGIIAMKPLAGGHLYREPGIAYAYLNALGMIDAVAVGMQSEAEISMNVALFSGNTPDINIAEACHIAEKRLIVQDWCDGCGKCAARCSQGAMSIINGKAVPNHTRCVLCGYCAADCREFCIKVV